MLVISFDPFAITKIVLVNGALLYLQIAKLCTQVGMDNMLGLIKCPGPLK
jgi:hypothetical protein